MALARVAKVAVIAAEIVEAPCRKIAALEGVFRAGFTRGGGLE
jgi:hypothetical protein